MSIALPALRGTAQQALYPFKRTIKCSTLVSTNQDGSRQASIIDNPRVLFDLPFTRLSQADKNSVMAFAGSAKGQYATNETVTLGNVTYSGLSLDSDLYSGSVRAAAMWDSALKLTQTIPQNLRPTTTLSANATATDTSITVASVSGFNGTGYVTVGTETMLITDTPDSTHFTVLRHQLGTTAATHSTGDTVYFGPNYALGAAFPALPNGTRTQIPWQQNQKYKTEVSSLASGAKFAFPWYGGHLVNFPTAGLRQWQVGGDMLTDSEVALLESHFLANWGRFGSFTFTDPETGTAYTNSYYTTDEMVIEYVEPNVNRVRLTVESYEQGSGITSAVFSMLSSHVPGGGYDAIGAATTLLPWGYAPGALFSGAFLYSGASWTLATNTETLTVSTSPLAKLVASFYIDGTLVGSASPPDEFLIYDCSVLVTYSDGTTQTLRPTKYGIVQSNGTILNPGNLIDNDPTTAATIERSTFAGAATPSVLQVTNFY